MTRHWILLALTALCGCAVGPDYHRPVPPAARSLSSEPLTDTPATDAIGGEAQHFEYGQGIDRRWWQAYQSPRLNALVDEALAANPDLQAAQAGVRAANEAAAAQRAAYFPQVNGTWNSSREQDALGTLSPTLSTGQSIYTLHTAQVTVSYVLDVFGGNRRAVESLSAQAEAARDQVQATYLTLVANTVVAAVTQASLQAQVEATQQIIGRAQEESRLLHQQYQLGAVSQTQVSAQQALLAQAQATLPGLHAQWLQQHDLLAQLTGRTPSELPLQSSPLQELQLPQQVPLSLPSRLVDARPDVRAAAAQLHAATAQVGVAEAARLPQIALSADAGTTATQLHRLLQAGTRFWSLGASLSQTLFDAGELRHRQGVAVAQMDQAADQYRSVVLLAFRQVADALAAVQADAATLQAEAQAEAAAAQTLLLTERNVQLGASSNLDLLAAQRLEQQALIAVVQARAARLSDTAALFQALGGDDWQPPAAR